VSRLQYGAGRRHLSDILLMVPPDKTKSLSPRGERLVLRGATLIQSCDYLVRYCPTGNTPGCDNATLAPKPTWFSDLSVWGSRDHSNPAQVSAHTLPDSLNLAYGCTIPVQRLCRIRLGGIVVRHTALVKSVYGKPP